MEIARPTFWNLPHWIVAGKYVFVVGSLIVFGYGVYRRARQWSAHKPTADTVLLSTRLKRLFLEPLVPRGWSVDPWDKMASLAIAWGVLIPFLAVPLVTADWYVGYVILGSQFLTGSWFLSFEVVTELFGLLLVVGLAAAACRRGLPRPAGRQARARGTLHWDSSVLWTMLVVVTLSGFLHEGLRLAAGDFASASWTPIGAGLAWLLAPIPAPATIALYRATWLFHIGLAYVLFACVPYAEVFDPDGSPAPDRGRAGLGKALAQPGQ